MPLPPAKDGMIYAILLDTESAHRYFRQLNGPGLYGEIYVNVRKPEMHGRVVVEWKSIEPEQTLESVLEFMDFQGFPKPQVATIFEVPITAYREDHKALEIAFQKANADCDCGW